MSLWNYSSTKLELLVLNTYLLGSKFIVYMDNNPLQYIQTSKLGTLQIRWLSELVLFDLTIKCRAKKYNKAAGTLRQHPINLNLSSKSETDKNEVDVSSYSLVSELTDLQLKWHQYQ